MPISPSKLATLPTADMANRDFMANNQQYAPKAPSTSSASQGTITDNKGIVWNKDAYAQQQADLKKYFPTVMETGTKIDKTVPELQAKGNAIAQEINQSKVNNEVPKTEEQLVADAIKSADQSGMFEESEEMKQLQNMMKQNLDAQTQASLSAIQQQYEQKAGLLSESQRSSSAALNASLMLMGGRYAPSSTQKIMSAKERYDIQTLSSLQIDEQTAKSKVLQAQKEGNFALMEKQMGRLETLRKEKLSYAQKIAESIAKQNKEISDRLYESEKELQKNISSITVDAGKAGAPPEVINAIQKSETLSDAVNAAGDYLQTGGTGIVAEYNFYKKDAKARGLTPVSFDEYQTKDANRKVSIAQAGIAGTSLDTKQQTVFNSIVTKYNASPAIQALDRANQLKNILLDAEKNPANAGSQLNLLYAYIKGLDTDSAVREGELDLVKGISNYFSKYEMSFNKLSKNQAVPLSVITDMIAGGKKLVSSIEETANRKKKVFEAQAKVNGTQVYEAWKDFDESISSMGSLSSELVSTSENAKKAVDDFIIANPNKADEIATLAENNYTDEQILEYLNLIR
jgi:hypothetical protein